ncbi:MAG: iron ABC transporter permease [Gammaproteobacteria bacterium]|nr:iron ABC transporter permease [Gammaproteobacteria bacterium]MCP5298390.1 iron ABC transporter permease [Chromatiaceae bacterium]
MAGHRRLLLAALGLTTGSLLLAVTVGSVDIPAVEAIGHLFTDDGSVHDRIIDELRLPRALTAFAVGGLLAVAGVLMQVLLRNPLADPYVLGVSGGAAGAVLGAMLLALSAAWLTPAAVVGALFSTLLVFGMTHASDDWRSDRLLLTGVVVAAGWAALISFVLSVSPMQQLPGMLFWLMGDLGDATAPGLPLTLLVTAVLLLSLRARDLNVAAQGMLQAAALGVDTARLRMELYFVGATLTAAAVAVGGAIGFVGLIVPHLVRRVGGTDHRVLIPVAALSGGSLLLLADTAARTLIRPMQLPVGVLTALIGVPIFLYLLQRQAAR